MFRSIVLAFLLIFPASLVSAQESPLQVLATTTLIADVARNVGGDLVEVTALVPPESDSHAFQPTPQDLLRVSQAQVLLINGAGLEESLLDLVENAATVEPVVVSYGVEMLSTEDDAPLGRLGIDVDCGDDADAHDHDDEADDHDDEAEHDEVEHAHDESEHAHGICDPHVWWNPLNVQHWALNIAAAFAEADPTNAETYHANADAYNATLVELDQNIALNLEFIPEAERVLVLHHNFLRYFAARYNFELIGTLLPGGSTLAEANPRDLAALLERIQASGVPVIITEDTDTSGLVESLVADLQDVEMLRLAAESLSLPEGPMTNYIDFMTVNVQALGFAYEEPVDFGAESDDFSEATATPAPSLS